MREEFMEPHDLALCVQVAHDLRQHRRQRPGPAQVTGKPVVVGEFAVASVPARHLRVQTAAGVVETGHDRWHKRIDLAERITDPAARRWVFEMAGVTDEHPAGSGRFAEKSNPTQHAEELAHPLGIREGARNRLAAAGGFP